MADYDKNRLLQNIAYLMRVHNVKIGELENTAGVSSGYLSRLKNNDNPDACPSVENLMSFADTLHTNIIVLLYCDLTSLTETELFIYRFLESMLKQTSENTILWERLTKNYLYTYYPNEGKPHILMAEDPSDESIYYNSLFTTDNVWLDGPAYKLERFSQDFYIAKVSHNYDGVHKTEYEMYLYKDRQRRTICNATEESKRTFITLLAALYEAAAASSNVIKIDEKVKDGLESFMSGDDDKCPF